MNQPNRVEDSAPHPAASSEEEKPGAPPDTQHAADALAAAQLKIAELEEQFWRAKEDLEKAYKFAIERFAEELLPVIDSLEAAAADTSGELGKLREGVALTLR